MKKILILSALFLVLAQGLIGQTSSAAKGIYVWPFQLTNGTKNDFTASITDTYQSICSENIKGYTFVSRQKFATLLQHRQNEVIINEGNVNFSKQVKDILTTNGASIAVFGTIKFIPSQEMYTLNIMVVNIFTTDILANPEKNCTQDSFENIALRRVFLKSLVPKLPIDYGSSGSGSGGILRRTQLESNSEVWRYVQSVYFEDFSNWNARKDFRREIWNKKDDKDHSCGIYFGRYLMKNKRNGFLKHKYIENKSIGISTDFSMAHPMSVMLHVPDTLDCFGTKGCLGRGITTRFTVQQNSGYALTLTDDGELKFFKFKNIHDPNNIEPLYSTKVSIPKKDVEIGLISLKDEFFIYYNREFMKVVKDSAYQTGINGVVAFGKGTHWFDDITVFNQVRVN